MEITDSIAEACRSSWPEHIIKISYGLKDNDFIDRISIHRPLAIRNEVKNRCPRIWIGNIAIQDDKIWVEITSSSAFSGKDPVYKNVLSNPKSLDEIFTILSAHILDVEGIIPVSPPRPTNNELLAKKYRMASTLPTRLNILKWQIDDDGAVGYPEPI